MAFPNSLELKFTNILRTPTRTDVTARVYKLSDGGVDVDGRQQYSRILVGERNFSFDAGEFSTVLVQRLLVRLDAINTQLALGYTPDKYICTL